MRRVPRWVTVLAGVLAALGSCRWSLNSYESQINDSIRLMAHAHRLSEIRTREGAFPASFDGADYYGRPVYYVSDGTRFALVSFGRDGQPDRAYDAKLLDEPTQPRDRVCFHPNRDTVFRESGPVVYCLE